MKKEDLLHLIENLEEYANKACGSGFDASDLAEYGDSYNHDAIKLNLDDINSWRLVYAAEAAQAVPILIQAIRDLHLEVGRLKTEKERVQEAVIEAKILGGAYDKKTI